MQVAKPKKGYKLVKTSFGKYEEIPEEWKMNKLEDLFCVGSSKRVLQSQWQSKGVPFYRGREITTLSHYGKVDNDLFISKDLYDEHASKYGVPKVGDIMITAIGTIGNSYIVTNKDKFYFKDASILWLDKKSDVDSKFINYWIKSEGFSKQLDEGNGSTVETLTVKKLQSILSPVPPLPEQKQIASILSNVDDTLQKTNQIIEQTQHLKNGMMQNLLTRGIGHTKFKKVKWYFGKQLEIPEEWEVSPIEKFLDIVMGLSPPSETYNSDSNGLPFFQGNVDFGEIFPETRIWCSKPNKIAKSNQILLSVRAPVGEINLSNSECCIGRGLATLIPIKSDLMYCFHLLKFHSNKLRQFSQGSTFEAINRQHIADLLLPFTKNIQEQKQIASILSNVDTQIQKEKLHKSNLERLKKGLMQKLLTGQIRVKVR